jgi:hypothetical protein
MNKIIIIKREKKERERKREKKREKDTTLNVTTLIRWT